MRRAGARWREEAPAYIADCFDHPKFSDRFTVYLSPEEDGRVMYIGATENGGTYFGESTIGEARAFRYRSGHQRVRWLDLPAAVRQAIVSRMAD